MFLLCHEHNPGEYDSVPFNLQVLSNSYFYIFSILFFSQSGKSYWLNYSKRGIFIYFSFSLKNLKND